MSTQQDSAQIGHRLDEIKIRLHLRPPLLPAPHDGQQRGAVARRVHGKGRGRVVVGERDWQRFLQLAQALELNQERINVGRAFGG